MQHCQPLQALLIQLPPSCRHAHAVSDSTASNDIEHVTENIDYNELFDLPIVIRWQPETKNPYLFLYIYRTSHALLASLNGVNISF